MREYALYVRINGEWELVSRIHAISHMAALMHAVAALQPEHYDKAIRFEEIQPDATG
jgi:hypothetical protein